MTQADLAQPEFTKGFISLLETGRTRASLRAAEIIARKLGVSAAELIGADGASDERPVELAMLRGEQQLTAGDAQAALDAANSVMGKATGVLKIRAIRLRGRALLELGRGPEAIPILDEADRHFRSRGLDELALRTRFDLARAHLRVDAISEAINLALDVERRITDGVVVDRSLELQVLRFLGNAFVAAGDLASAGARMARALQVAEDIGDPATLGALYAGLAIARDEQGDLDAALQYARKALLHYEQVARQREVAEAWNTIGWVLTRRGNFAKAAESLARAATLAREAKHERLEALVVVSQAELAHEQGDHAEAIRLAKSAADDPRASNWAKAHAAWTTARAVASGQPKPAALRAAYDAAIRAAQALPRRWRAQIHESYAQALAEREDWKAAALHLEEALKLSRVTTP